MTPQLQQAIKLLQLSNLELAAYVEQELEQNPLLERDDGAVEPEQGAEPERNAGEGDANGNGAAEPQLLDPVDGRAKDASETPLDTDFGNVWSEEGGDGAHSSPTGAAAAGASDFDDSEVGLDQTPVARRVAARPSAGPAQRRGRPIPSTASSPRHLIDLLDEAGYLTGDIAQVAEVLDCSVARVEATLEHAAALRPARRRSRAASRNAWRCSCASATASIRRCRRCSTISTCWPSATSRR